MCRIEERVYISAEGHSSKFEDTFRCDKARNGKLCADVKKKTTKYYPKKGAVSRNDTPSPINPPTPTGTGSYLVEQRRPSSSGGRPSTRDGQKSIKPEIVISFGTKKEKGKKYPSVSVSSKSYKRSSRGSSSFEDIAVESPGSDASHTIRTGFPEAPLPPSGYGTTPAVSQGYHHRHTSSTSSYTGSSRTPSLYVTSDPDLDSPTGTRNTRVPPAIHQSSTVGAPPSPIKSSMRPVYNTAVITPNGYSQDVRTSDGLLSHEYHDFADRSASSYASSGASGTTRRERDEYHSRKKDEERRRQEEKDREYAEALAKEENVKQVRFELDRAKGRADIRAETKLAESEKARAAAREEARLVKQQERDEAAARERRREKDRTSKPVVSNSKSKRPDSRRNSITLTQADRDEQRRLLAADLSHMHEENKAAEAREREENNALLRQKQQDLDYYNPRTGGMIESTSSLARRESLSTRADTASRRNSLSSEGRPMLSRSNSGRRTSIVQPNPPVVNTQVGQSYRGPPSAREHRPPPVSFPANFNTRPGPSARRPSFDGQSSRRPSFSSTENPFASNLPHSSASSLENPFAPPSSILSPPIVHQDPWDARSVRNALPNQTRQSSDGRYSTRRRGDDGVGSAAREATKAMSRAAGYASAFETDSEDEPARRPRRKQY